MADAHDEHVSRKTYYIVFAALMILLFLTIEVAYLPLGSWALWIAMLIAVVKAVLVVVYFMHLKVSYRLIWVTAAAGFIWLAIMIGGVVQDYMSRGWFGPNGVQVDLDAPPPQDAPAETAQPRGVPGDGGQTGGH